MRLGILGGTFDPLHLGHVAAADAARGRLALDRVIVVPALDPPHRPSDPHASSYHRFAMAALAVAGLEGFEMSDLEMLRPPPSYTAHTLAHLADEGYHPSQLFFITGTDAFAEVANWHEYPHVLDLAHFVVVARPGHGMSAVRDRLDALTARMLDATTLDAAALGRIDYPGAPTRVLFLEAPTPDISATDIRHRIATGQTVAGLVAPAVAAYIEEHHLYRVSASPGRRLA
jgi:nicotinate-nucleotide adenylyltransferase